MTVDIDATDAPSVSVSNVGFYVYDVPLTASLTPNPISFVWNGIANGLITEESPTGTLPVATFTDANPFATIANADYSGTINWGDGTGNQAFTSANVTQVSGTTFAVNDGHTYAEQGTYQVTVTIDDNDVGPGPLVTTTATNTVITVADAPLLDAHRPEYDHANGTWRLAAR